MTQARPTPESARDPHGTMPAENLPAPDAHGRNQGEGNRDAARRYEAGVQQHVKSHDVEREARDAAPDDVEEAREMERAEQAGRERAKG